MDMPLRLRKIRLLLAASLALGSSARATTGPTATPPQGPGIRLATKQDAQNPAIARVEDPAVLCVPAGAPTNGSGNPAASTCLPQADALKRAGEAASYLAHYHQNFSAYGYRLSNPQSRQTVQDALRDCVNNSPACDDAKRAEVLAALVQYNFGKEIKAQMLENQLRAAQMKAIDKSPGAPRPLSFQNSLKGGTVLKSSFRLDPTTVPVLDFSRMSEAERQQLGANFNREFQGFVNEYTSSTGQNNQPKSRWHYVTAVSEAGGNRTYVPAVDERNPSRVKIDSARMEHDVRVQNSPEVQEIVKGYVERQRDRLAPVPGGANLDNMQAATQQLGFGMLQQERDPDNPNRVLTPSEVAQAVVVTMNKNVVDAENRLRGNGNSPETPAGDQRVPATAASRPAPAQPAGRRPPNITSTSVHVDARQFDQFLNNIWPASAARPAP